MSLPNSLRAYDDCVALYERAMADPKGARARLGTYGACKHMQTRMHYYRDLDRSANAVTYPLGDPMHRTSAYDGLVIQIIPDEDKQYWLYISKRAVPDIIEGLSDVEDLIEVEGSEVHLIEDKTEQGT